MFLVVCLLRIQFFVSVSQIFFSSRNIMCVIPYTLRHFQCFNNSSFLMVLSTILFTTINTFDNKDIADST